MKVKEFPKISWIKTLYFNLHYFPLKVALRQPFLIYRRTTLEQMGGKIILKAKPSFGMVKIGRQGLGFQDSRTRTIWKCGGTFIIRGGADIDKGTRGLV